MASKQPGPLGTCEVSADRSGFGAMTAGRCAPQGTLGSARPGGPEERPPQYAYLSFATVLAYRPSGDGVAEWHTAARGDSFLTIAAQHQVPVAKIIEFNFPASVRDGHVDPAIVNWYLHHHRDFRCPMTHDRLNRIFKGGEKIAIPYLGTVTLGEPTFRGVRGMSAEAKLETAIRRSLPMLPEEARDTVMAMLTPEALAIVLGTLVVWAGSHLFGVGEIVDIILLVVGFAVLGASVLSGAQELYDFATTAVNAKSDPDLDRAAHHFAKAVSILGVAVITALLMRSSLKSVAGRGAPKVRPMPKLGAAPAAGARITRPFSLPSGALGECDWWGNISVIRNQILSEQRLTLLHEWVHSVLSPRLGPLRVLRAQLKASGYWRSALLRYLEEAMAESYAQLRLAGMREALAAIRFPIDGGYVTVSQLIAEGTAIGNIVIGGMQFTVGVVEEKWESLVK